VHGVSKSWTQLSDRTTRKERGEVKSLPSRLKKLMTMMSQGFSEQRILGTQVGAMYLMSCWKFSAVNSSFKHQGNPGTGRLK